MSEWRRWIRPGLAVTIALALLAFFIRSGAVEEQLAARVKARLAAGGQDWASVTVSGRDVTIVGTAPAVEAQRVATSIAAAVGGVRRVADGSALLPVASPYVWSARKAGRVVTMLGSIPSEAYRNSLFAAARRALPAAEIHDEMKLARGAPASFNQATAFALARLADLSDGTVMLTDGTLSVTGTAANGGTFASMRQALARDIPNTIVLGPVDILPPRADPFVWSANYDGTSVVLAGFVPNDIVRDALIATAKATLAGVPVVDHMAIASGEPDDFAEAASFAITALDRFTQGGVTLDGLSLDIAGDARTVDDYEAVLANLTTNLPAGMKVVSSAITPATVSPYGWAASKDGAAVVLTGYVPSAEAQAAVAATAKALFPGGKIANRLRVAGGEPDIDWVAAIKFALTELAKLSKGSVTLGDGTYAVAGEATTPEAFSDLLAANAGGLPAGVRLESADLTAPPVSPYRFSAERAPGSVKLAGYVASEDDRQAILTAVSRKFGSFKVVDGLAYATGEPDGYLPAVRAALQAVSRLAGGRAEMVNGAVKITGDAYYPAAVEDITDSVSASMPEGISVSAKVASRQGDQPVSAQKCRDMLQSVLGTGRIAFDGNQADITTDSFGLLDRVAATIARCPDARIEVGAHSDSKGSASRNRNRTQARADAIVDYLVAAGVKRERLSAVGYGEAKPVADNGTPEGRAANQRIEFTVAVPQGG